MAADDDNQTGYAKLVGKRHVEAQGGAGGMIDEDFEALVTALPARLGRTGGGVPQGEAGCFVALGQIKSLSRHHATIEWDFDKGCYRISCHSKNGMVVNKAHYARDEKAFLPHGSAVRIGPVTFYFHLPPQPGGGGGGNGNQAALVLSSDDDGESGGGGDGGGGSGDESKGGGTRFGTGTDRDDDHSRASSSVAGGGGSGRPSVERASMGNGKGKGSRTYSGMVYDAFASPELVELARSQGLTSSDVTAWIIERYPEYGAADRKKQLQNGVQNTLTRKFAKQETSAPLPAGQRGSRWKMAGASSSASSSVAAASTPAAAAAASLSSPASSPGGESAVAAPGPATSPAAAPAASASPSPAAPVQQAAPAAAEAPVAAAAAEGGDGEEVSMMEVDAGEGEGGGQGQHMDAAE